jgi:nitrite reductase/ring-hydroxylating ferredoxin subunit
MSAIPLVRIGEMVDGEIRPIEVDGRHLLLVNSEKGPSLIDRICPHAGGDLAKGKVVSSRIRCPTHSYLFNLETGVCPLGRREGWGPLAVYELFEREGQLCVEFAD